MRYRLNIEPETFEFPETEDTLELVGEDLEDLEDSHESDKEEIFGRERYEDFEMPVPTAPSGLRIEDRTNVARKDRRKGRRDPATVKALVLHQMAFSRGNNPDRYNAVTAHYAILPDGRILQLHPVSALLHASNSFNRKSVAVEFAGNFPNTRGKCWEAKKFGCYKLTQAQIEAGRYLVKHLIKEIGLTHIFAHRQAAGTRENCPGPDIWYNAGQWAVDNLGLKDGGPEFKIGTGNPIPDEWRNWGRSTAQPELTEASDLAPYSTGEWQGEVGRESREYIQWVQRSLNRNMGVNLVVDGIMGSQTRSAIRSFQQKQGLVVDGIVGPKTEATLIAAGATSPPKTKEMPKPAPIGTPAQCAPPLELTPAERTALAVTTNFETGRPFGCVVSPVDGISMGMIQWNLKAGTLQALLKKFEQIGGNLQSFFGTEVVNVRRLINLSTDEAVSLAKSEGLATRWRNALLRLCSNQLFCNLQTENIKQRINSATSAARELGLRTVRGLAMMFDINVGDGYGRGRKKITDFKERIMQSAIELGRQLTEQEKLVKIADRAARYARKYEAQRRARRMLIANGHGYYRRRDWDLDGLFPTLNDPSGI